MNNPCCQCGDEMNGLHDDYSFMCSECSEIWCDNCVQNSDWVFEEEESWCPDCYHEIHTIIEKEVQESNVKGRK